MRSGKAAVVARLLWWQGCYYVSPEPTMVEKLTTDLVTVPTPLLTPATDSRSFGTLSSNLETIFITPTISRAMVLKRPCIGAEKSVVMPVECM